MELIIGVVGSAFIGYLVNKLERLEAKIDTIEADIIVLKIHIPKRKEDYG